VPPLLKPPYFLLTVPRTASFPQSTQPFVASPQPSSSRDLSRFSWAFELFQPCQNVRSAYCPGTFFLAWPGIARWRPNARFVNRDLVALRFDCALVQGSLLKKIVEAMKDLVTDANLECGEEGLKLQAMDSSHVSLISLSLNKEGLEDYRCDRSLFLGLNLVCTSTPVQQHGRDALHAGFLCTTCAHPSSANSCTGAVPFRNRLQVNLSKILKCAGNDDSITLRAEDEGDSVALMFESKGVCLARCGRRRPFPARTFSPRARLSLLRALYPQMPSRSLTSSSSSWILTGSTLPSQRRVRYNRKEGLEVVWSRRRSSLIDDCGRPATAIM